MADEYLTIAAVYEGVLQMSLNVQKAEGNIIPYLVSYLFAVLTGVVGIVAGMRVREFMFRLLTNKFLNVWATTASGRICLIPNSGILQSNDGYTMSLTAGCASLE